MAFSDVLQDSGSSDHSTAHHGGLAFDGMETRTPMFPGSSRCFLTGFYSRQEGIDMDGRLENLHRIAISGEPALAAAVMFHIAIAAALSDTGQAQVKFFDVLVLPEHFGLAIQHDSTVFH